MVGLPSYNPFSTQSAFGTFNLDNDGYIQGCALDNPAVRYQLAGGVLLDSETKVMYGGLPISENVPGTTAQPRPALGGGIIRATGLPGHSAGNMTGFSVFDQLYSAVNFPGQPVPVVPSGGSVHFYRLGSQARIPVQIDPSLVDLQGNIITQQVSWDFNNNVLQPYTGTATYSITSMTWANTNGGQITVVAAVATPVAAVGDLVNISGATNTGTGGNAAVNGNFTVVAFTDNQHFVLAAPAAAGVIGTIAGTILANYDSGALAVSVLEVKIGNNMVVVGPDINGNYTWNRNGSVAVILI